jgi:hypothetical protein
VAGAEEFAEKVGELLDVTTKYRRDLLTLISEDEAAGVLCSCVVGQRISETGVASRALPPWSAT